MKYLYATASSLLFLLAHVLVLLLKLSEGATFALILLIMILTQLLVFVLVKRKQKEKENTFYGILGLLCLTQFLSVTLLTLFSLLNPLGDAKPVYFMDVLVSIALFVVVLPLLITTFIWFAGAKPKQA